MPFIRFTGFEKEFIERIAPVFIERFASIANIPQDIVKLELLLVEKITNSPSSVEIMMFPREHEKHDAIAAMIHSLLEEHGYPHTHIFYVLLNPSLYYKKGLPLREIPENNSM